MVDGGFGEEEEEEEAMVEGKLLEETEEAAVGTEDASGSTIESNAEPTEEVLVSEGRLSDGILERFEDREEEAETGTDSVDIDVERGMLNVVDPLPMIYRLSSSLDEVKGFVHQVLQGRGSSAGCNVMNLFRSGDRADHTQGGEGRRGSLNCQGRGKGRNITQEVLGEAKSRVAVGLPVGSKEDGGLRECGRCVQETSGRCMGGFDLKNEGGRSALHIGCSKTLDRCVQAHSHKRTSLELLSAGWGAGGGAVRSNRATTRWSNQPTGSHPQHRHLGLSPNSPPHHEPIHNH